MELLKQLRIAIVGLPDSGKSTFISFVVSKIAHRKINPDALMHEVHWSDGKDPYGNPDTRTIKCAKITFYWDDIEIMMYDCPGHLEYKSQIKQGLDMCNFAIKIIDDKREKESYRYFDNDIFLRRENKLITEFHSHSNLCDDIHYDSEDTFDKVIKRLESMILSYIKNNQSELIDVEKEAIDYLRAYMPAFDGNKAMMFSGGKDSIVGLDLIDRAGFLDDIDVLFPESKDDFDEIYTSLRDTERKYNIKITHFDNTNNLNINDCSPFEWMQSKGLSNNKIIKRNDIRLLLVNYRSSDEGIRSKDWQISDKKDHFRLSPVFYFSESNIWRYISKYQLRFPRLYLEGYRSLGDKTFTLPCMPSFHNSNQIIDYIESNQSTQERDGRKKQDNAEKYTMEKLRNVGFF